MFYRCKNIYICKINLGKRLNNKRIFIERFASPPQDSNDNLRPLQETLWSFAPVFRRFDADFFQLLGEEADGGKRLGLFEFSLQQSKHPENLLTSNTSLKRAGGQRRFFFPSSFFLAEPSLFIYEKQ